MLNNIMGKKFDAIFEAVTHRMTSGGYLPGDIVVFRSNYKSCECYKNLPTKIQKDLDEMVKSGLNIKVVQVGDNLSGSNANNQYKTSSSAVITVAADHGGGRYYSAITISPEMIDLAESDGINLPKIPDQFRRDDKQAYKPEKFKRDDKFITNVTDKGNGKNTPTNLKLAGESYKFEKAVQSFRKGSGQEIDILQRLIPSMLEAAEQGLDIGGWVRSIAKTDDIRVQNFDMDIIDLLQKTYDSILDKQRLLNRQYLNNGKNTPTNLKLAGESYKFEKAVSTMIKNDMANLADLYVETLKM
jgi:hypothetical protein